MEAEGDLDPELPPITQAGQSLHKPAFNRKRTWDFDAAITNSSDPAVFSSDDNAISLDDYASKRRKNQWKGTWWGERVKRMDGSRRSQREFKRNYDSGIFMGSEGTESSFDDDFFDDFVNKQVNGPLQSLVKEKVTSSAGSETGVDPQPGNQATDGSSSRDRLYPRNPVSERVRTIIHQCLEDGNETADLS